MLGIKKSIFIYISCLVPTALSSLELDGVVSVVQYFLVSVSFTFIKMYQVNSQRTLYLVKDDLWLTMGYCNLNNFCPYGSQIKKWRMQCFKLVLTIFNCLPVEKWFIFYDVPFLSDYGKTKRKGSRFGRRQLICKNGPVAICYI